MSDPIFTKSFSGYQRKRLGCWAIFLGFIVAFGISSTFKPQLHQLPPLDDSVKLQLSIDLAQEMNMIDDNTTNSKPTAGNAAEDLTITTAENNATSTTFRPTAMEDKNKKLKTICRNSNYCEIEGDIRIEAKSSTIYIVSPLKTISNSTNSWSIEPYPRKGTSKVRNWTITHIQRDQKTPECTQNHSHIPAILFSVGGFTGNFFHDFADVLFPLYSTSFHFQGDVHFLASDYRPWWIRKFRSILNNLTKHEIFDIDSDASLVHCYNKLVVGLRFHKELIIDPSLPISRSGPSMQNFRQLLRQAYSLQRGTPKGGGARPPRLMIISRKRSRIITNEGQVSRLARKLGFDVVLAEASLSTNISRFAETANSCDVLMGVHGAGLTNMVFLPDNAILIQLVPFGAVDGFARLDFGNPAYGMKIHYLEYKISVKESSLSQKYAIDDPILSDAKSYKRWEELWSIYLDQQNVTIDLRRFRGTLVKALKLLRH